MYRIKYNQEQLKKYYSMLGLIGSLSNLFSDSEVPYLYYRIAERLYCNVFKASNYTRSDIAIDASLKGIGVGLKTFICNTSYTSQKISEFNKMSQDIVNRPDNELIHAVSVYRNDRIHFITRSYSGISDFIYHCVARRKKELIVFEEPMNLININNLRILNIRDHVIEYTDDNGIYSFNKSKSTLFKRFIIPEEFVSVEVDIIDDPISRLESLLKIEIKPKRKEESLILPLYSFQDKDVNPKSGLNQWNGQGRKRHPDEVYIPIPAWIHHTFPNFFPSINSVFYLTLPNNKKLLAKMCQGALININGKKINKGKGLMSNPNKELGKWLLRDVLNVPINTVVTMQDLIRIGIDSVEIRKINDSNYFMDFKKVGSFEDFFQANQEN